MAVHARGSTGWIMSSLAKLADVRLEFERSRLVDPSVRVRWILNVAEVTLPR